MKNQFDGMDEADFTSLVDSYIERTATGYGEMPAAIFLDLLAERTVTKAEETITLSFEIVDGQLVIRPDREVPGMVVRENEVVSGRYRLALKPFGQM